MKLKKYIYVFLYIQNANDRNFLTIYKILTFEKKVQNNVPKIGAVPPNGIK